MNPMKNYSSLLEAIEGLKKEGYTADFNLHPDCIQCAETELKLSPDEFVIDKYFRFEGDTDPSEQSIIYAISSKKHPIKGIFINAYGIYADPVSNEMMEALTIKEPRP
jgi:hypothetical protein